MTGRSRLIRLLAAGIALAGAFALASRLRLDQDISPLLPDTSPEVTRAWRVMGRMMDRAIVDIESPPGRFMPVDELGAAADRVAEELISSRSVASVRASFEASEALPVLDLARERAARLLDPALLARVEERIRPAAVKEAISALARRLLEPDGGALSASAARDPLGISALALAPLGGLLAGMGEARLSGGRVISGDGRHLLVLLEPGFPATDLQRDARLAAAMERAAASIAGDAISPGPKARWIGSHRSTLDNARRLQADIAWTSTAGIALMAGIALLTFRRAWLAALTLAPALFGAAIALAAFSLFRDSLPAPVAGFGAVFLGTTVDYAVHILFHIDRTGSACHLPIRELLLGTAATCAAFLALLASSLPGVRDIGALGAAGTAAAVLFAIVALPALAGRPRRERRPLLDLGRLVERARSRGGMRVAIAAAIVLSPLLGAGALRLRFDGEVDRLSSLSAETREAEKTVRGTWGEDLAIAAVVVEGKTVEDALRANDKAAAALARLRAEGAIGDAASISGILPSRRTQDERLSAWKSFWSEDRVAVLRQALEDGREGTPFRPGAFEPFLAWLRAEPPPLTADDLAGTPLGSLVAERVVAAGDSVLVSTPLFVRSGEGMSKVEERLGRELPAASVLSRGGLVRKLASMARGEVAKLGAIALGLVFAVVLLSLGRLELALVVMIPLVIGALWTLGVLGWLGIRVSLANAIFIALMFATAMDYAIFLAGSRLERFRSGKDPAEAESSVLLCAFTNLLGFGTLSAAGHPVLFSIGITAVAGIVCSMAATFVLVPALAAIFLVRPGPNMSPSLRNLRATCWVSGVMMWSALAHLLVRRRSAPAGDRRRAALEMIRRVGARIRAGMPGGRRLYAGDDRFSRPAIIVANHESNADALLVNGLPVTMTVATTVRIWKKPLFGRIAREAGYAGAEEMTAESMLGWAREALASGISVLVFPEQTRSTDGAIRRFHRAAFTFARAAGVPVIPVALVNSGTIMPKGAWWIGDHETRTVALDPLDPRDFPGDDGDRRMAAEARARILAERERLWLETQEGPGWHRPLAGMYRYLGPVASHYAASKARRDPLVLALPRLCPGADPVLVAGCGLGIMTSRLAIAFPRRTIMAVDRDPKKCGVARAALRGSPRAAVIEGDIREIDAGSPGTAVLADVLHYWPEEAQAEIAGRIASLLPAGGRLVFRDGCASERGHRLVGAAERLAILLGFTEGHGPLRFRSAEGWRALLERCGFAVLESRPDLGLLSNVVLVCRKR